MTLFEDWPNGGDGPSAYVDFDRRAWSRLASSTPLPLTHDDVARLRGLGDPIDLAEVDIVYRPLSRLLNLYVGATAELREATSTFLREQPERTPYVIGVAGSVAVGKSTTSRVLRELLARWPDTPNVALVTTDSFLYPNAELARRGLMSRKGFPESYDRRALLRFLTAVKSGEEEVATPVYDHVAYDIVPGARTVVRRPDVLIVEGLNVLQPAPTRPSRDDENVAVSDFFDFSIYVDARTADVRRWYVDRFLTLRRTFAHPASYFRRYASLTTEEAIAQAEQIWDSINAPNLIRNVLPTRSRATLVLTKGADHTVQEVRLRKL